jgi:hypothetical protein
MITTCGCKEIKKREVEMKRQQELQPSRMEIIFSHIDTWGVYDYYGLRDTRTGREYLVVMTGTSDGGVSVIELKPKEDEKY